VFDNMTDPKALRPYLPAAGQARVIITSNQQSAAQLGVAVPVDVFTQEEALTFLAARTGLADATGAAQLAGELGYLPLALEQAAAEITAQHLPYATYLGRLGRPIEDRPGLTEIRLTIRRALATAPGKVTGFSLSYPDSVFITKLLDWLRVYLPGQTEVKSPLILMPVIAATNLLLGQMRSYRHDLDTVNVLCQVHVEGAEADLIESFWESINTEFGGTEGLLVLLFIGDARTTFPDGLTALPTPQITRSDVEQWAEDLINQRGWPFNLARSWADWLCAQATVGEQLDIRLMYEAIDRSVSDLRYRPDSFRAMLENRV